MTELIAPTTPEDEALASPSLVELAVERLRGAILSGESNPGERLIEEQLTRRLGISRAPLREALRLLVQQGLVDHVPRRGVRVAVLSRTDADELFGVRDVLERYAVSLALPSPEPIDVSALNAALETMRSAEMRGDRLAVADAHRAFHSALVALAGNRQLQLAYDPLLAKLQLYMAVNLRREAESSEPADGVHRHERMLAAVASNTPAAVLAELDRHGGRSYLS
jgi:DNA-binding GntR family transcriptional regulator